MKGLLIALLAFAAASSFADVHCKLKNNVCNDKFCFLETGDYFDFILQDSQHIATFALSSLESKIIKSHVLNLPTASDVKSFQNKLRASKTSFRIEFKTVENDDLHITIPDDRNRSSGHLYKRNADGSLFAEFRENLLVTHLQGLTIYTKGFCKE